jgi:SAM-dependent methyltransferase
MSESNLIPGANRQQALYEGIHDLYEKHYYDPPSMSYRRNFIYDPLFAGLSLDGASVADLACGSGHNSKVLMELFPQVQTVGYDISERACIDYRMRLGRPAHHVDLTMPYNPPELHDAAIVIGGLHHCVSDLSTTLRNVARMMKSGGSFLMMEPNDEFILSFVRRIWYRHDKLFEADTEHALKHDELAELAKPYFIPEKVTYFGGPAFYLILNSLVTRMPLGAKPAIAAITFPIERTYNLLPGRAPFAGFLARWRRTDVAA